MSTIKFDKWENPDGTENYKCRAFVAFNGDGVLAIIHGGNVSSVTDTAIGDYTVNFASDVPAGSSAQVAFNSGTTLSNIGIRVNNTLASSVRIRLALDSVAYDPTLVNVTVVG